MEMKPENVPDELLAQAGMVCAVTHPYEYFRHCPRNLRHLHDWPRHSDDSSR